MENKKQLVIVPPMSEPLQKLNEVLQAISSEENVEVSIIDDRKELAQFIGSSGQCLIAFSNAKKCATFLQENRFIVAKTHSKTILLTPKEIPAKTLAKFVKVGLTESILENSPPKTLLYKVKLLLRSIKSSSSSQEEKDQVIKSMIDFGATSGKSEHVDKIHNESPEANETETETKDYAQNLNDEKAREIERELLKNLLPENVVGFGEHVVRKKEREDSIVTHWKSKIRSKDSVEIEGAENLKLEDDESDVDTYYRTKKKKKTAGELDDQEEDLYGKKIYRQEKSENKKDKDLTRRSLNETNLALGEKEVLDRQVYEYEEDDLSTEKSRESQINLEAKETDEAMDLTSEEKKAENRKKEFEELEALFEEAKKKQAAEQAKELGYLKGKINTSVEIEKEDEEEEEKEYDNSELYKREKSVNLKVLSGADNKKKRPSEEEDDENDSKDAEVDKLDDNMRGEDGTTEKIKSNMLGISSETAPQKSRSKNSSSSEEEQEEKAKENLESYYREEEREKKSKPDDLAEKISKRNQLSQKDETQKEDIDEERQSLLSEEEEDGPEKRNSMVENSRAQGLERKQKAKDESDDDSEDNKRKEDSERKKGDRTKEAQDKKKDRAPHTGKVEKIDTYYRGIERKTEYSWDNLSTKGRSVNFKTEKLKREDLEDEARETQADNGEIIIDYRQLKKEFEQIARDEHSLESESDFTSQSTSLSDTEDEGSFKVIEADDRGFDFAINILNLIYQKDTKAQDFFIMISEELISKYKAYPAFYNFKAYEEKHSEAFDSMLHFSTNLVSNEIKEWRVDNRSETSVMDYYASKSITTWLCRELQGKTGSNGNFWEDVELPQWAANELADKKVELVYPYYDGIDRMGMAVVFFPYGINPKLEKGLAITLEMARTIFLENIQLKASTSNELDQAEEENTEKKTNILKMFSGFFNKNKAG